MGQWVMGQWVTWSRVNGSSRMSQWVDGPVRLGSVGYWSAGEWVSKSKESPHSAGLQLHGSPPRVYNPFTDPPLSC